MSGLAGNGPGGRLAIFTICSNNYVPFARVLFESVRRHHPEAALFLCLADRKADLPGSYGEVTVVEAHALGVPDFPAFAFRYDIMEFNTALKPFMVLHLLETLGFQAVLYFDPDIELFAPLSGVLGHLWAGASFVLTPHLCSPSEDRREPNDLTILRAGAYNLGFLGVSRTVRAAEVVRWWARRLRFQCINAQAEGLFVDQKFMDLVPGFAPDAVVSRDTTLNVAYWNLAQRRLDLMKEGAGDGWTVDGAPLTFFHFSGFNPRNPARLSRHDPRFVGELPPPLGLLTARYAGQLFAQGYEALSPVPYAYGRFASGSTISPQARRAFRALDHWEGDPFATFETANPACGPACREDAA